MPYTTEYETPLVGRVTIASDGDSVVGLWLEGQRRFAQGIDGPLERRDGLPVLCRAADWLDRYFAGARPDPHEVPLNLRGTEFSLLVWEALLEIPYGCTVSYGTAARLVGRRTGRAPCPRAVGRAVGGNPVSIIVACHRVVGADGGLTGYAGGLDRKRALLVHEGALQGPTPAECRGGTGR